MDDIINEIYKLNLDDLNDEWVQNIFDSEFLEYEEIPVEYEIILESLEIKPLFRTIMSAIDNWLNSDFNEEEKSWKVLSYQIKHQSLLALLAYYIDLGGKNVVSREHRNKALFASRLYYKLLSIPGYKAYHIYHSQLFAHSLLCLSYPRLMFDSEDTYLNAKDLVREINSVIKELSYLVADLKGIFPNLHLNSNEMNFEDILSNLVDIIGGTIVYKLDIDKIELGKISGVIYEMIDILMIAQNGSPNASAIQLLFKCLLPKLIAVTVDYRSAHSLVRASYVSYSGFTLVKYGKAALSGFIVLLQHLCFTLDGLERSEVRSARVSLVVGLMSMLSSDPYKKFVIWLLQLSETAKVPHRQVAVEILAKLLNNNPEEIKPNQTAENTKSTNETVCGDNNDKNDTEGNNANGSVHNDYNEEAQPSTSAAANVSRAEVITVKDGDSQQSFKFRPCTQEEIAESLPQRFHTIAHGEVLRAVYERVHDVSSTLRSRALAILAESLQSEHPAVIEAIKELNGTGEVSRLAAIASRCVCDERAVVRKAAVALLQCLITTTHFGARTLVSDYAMLVGLCRDASVLVRSAAVGALGEVVARRADAAVLDAFLGGPMHQLCDPETKIQEQVVNLVQQLLILRLKIYSESGEDATPWLFLAAVIRHKMRPHLQKACTLLIKVPNCINHRLVDLLSTHLGVLNDERDLQCLVLLTSVARHVEYTDIDFLLEYYYKLAETPGRDGRLLPLTVELLSVWECGLAAAARAALRQHLVAHIASATNDGCRTGCALLAAQLDPENLQWATELMQISEQRALSGTDVNEWLRAVDVSLVAPAQPSPQLLRLFYGALVEPPPEWSAESLGVCVAGAGRLCVRSRVPAVALAPPLAALLRDVNAPLCARLNALLALTDICIRYSCIVEQQMDAVCGCVARGVAPALRRAAVRAITRLLLAGYLRLRTPLYYRFCALLADDDCEVREPVEYYVSCCLTVDTIFHHFVDCVLYYNNQETEAMSFDARQLVYDIMLQRMSLVQKLNVQCRLARDVLQHAADVCDERAALPPALHAALLDAITLLCGPRMKLPKKPDKNGEADYDDLQERVTTNIVSHKMKRTVAEELVPGVLRLFAHLRGRGGQLATYLVRIATDLLNDYQQEIEELLENDEELVERIKQFRETIGLEAPEGNARNLVTSSAPPDPATPRAPKRPARSQRTFVSKRRALGSFAPGRDC